MTEFRMTPLARTYSLQLTDQDPLPKSLSIVANAEQDEDRRKELELQQWREWIRFDGASSDRISKKLTRSSKLLADNWKRYGRQVDIDCTKFIEGHSIPTIDTLYNAVCDANAVRESNKESPMGQVRERFLSFTNTLNNYSFLFSIIPDNDKYTILITGVISSIAKAAAKYQDIAEKIAQALDRITYDVRQVKKHVEIADTEEIRGFVIEFWIGLFDLLCFALTWYKSRTKRFIAAFTKSFDNDLNEKIDAVQKTLKDLAAETNLITQRRIHDVHEDSADMKALLEQCAAKMEYLGHVAAQQLNGIDQSFAWHQITANTGFAGHRMIENLSPPIDETCSVLSTVPSDHQTSDRTVLRVPKSELLQYSQQLKPFIDDGRGLISKHCLSTARSVLPREVVGEMQKWMAIVNSKLLWVEGISSHASDPVLSTAALNICAIAQNSGIPCLSYFCTTIHERDKTTRRDPNATHTEATCVSLLYSIIIQLCENMPDDFIGAEEFEHQFQLLDGTLKSLEAAICLVERLFICLPPLTVWVLDRFPFAGTKSTAPYIKSLIDILRSGGDGRITKVLFTTEGNTPWLSGNLRAHEHFLASRMALNKPGRVMPGAVSPVFHGKFPKDEQET